MARLVLLFVFILVACAAANFWWQDTESIPWTPALEKNAPGRFLPSYQGVTHYELKGAPGRTVVLLSGYSVPYYLWDRVFPALVARGFRVLRYDFFGRGLSERPDLRYDGDLYDRQLVGLLDGLGIHERIDIVGPSAGGPIAAGFACRHPERVRSLVLLDSPYAMGVRDPLSLRLPFIAEYRMTTYDLPRMPQSQTEDFAHPERFPDWASRFREQMRIKGFRRALLSTRRSYLTEDWPKLYACVGVENIPVLLVWGQLDRAVPVSHFRQLQLAMPKAQSLEIEDAGHLPMMERPEVVNPALARFLSDGRL